MNFKSRLQPITHLNCEDVYHDEKYDLKYINKGNFAVVLSAIQKAEPQKRYAIKIINMENFDKMNMDRVHREVEINGIISHKNIVSVYEVYQTKTECSLVMELMEGGDLFSRIVDVGCMNETETKPIIAQVMSAVKYLHSIHIAHRDIKPENIVFEEAGFGGRVKLIDFGFSKKVSYETNSQLTTPVGTVGYFAPEITQTESYKMSVDMWSVGCIVYFMLTRCPPFHAKNEAEIEHRAARADFKFPPSILLSDRAKEFICQLICLNPENRMNAEEALDHKWLTAPTSTLTDSGKHKTEVMDETCKTKMRKSMNEIIDAQRGKDFLSPLDGINLDANDNPYWQVRRKK
jgi:calcium/calmodulin-dependent protein kinase I